MVLTQNGYQLYFVSNINKLFMCSLCGRNWIFKYNLNDIYASDKLMKWGMVELVALTLMLIIYEVWSSVFGSESDFPIWIQFLTQSLKLNSAR
jgi:hypothetical protein